MPNVQFFSRHDLDAHRARAAETAPTVQTPRRAAETAPTRPIERRPELGAPAPSRLQRALGEALIFLSVGAIATLTIYILLSPAPFGIAP